jgi:hypothetical protein
MKRLLAELHRPEISTNFAATALPVSYPPPGYSGPGVARRKLNWRAL